MTFGKILTYTVLDQAVRIHFEEREGQIEVYSDSIINIFAGHETADHNSYAIEGNKVQATWFRVEDSGGGICIRTERLQIRVYDEFKVDIYDSEGTLLCEDYRKKRCYEPAVSHASLILASQEGHEVNLVDKNHKIEVLKTMFGDESFYGMGDKTGHLNKKDYEYEMWNTNNPAPQVESFKSLYKSIPFYITLREQSVFGIFFDNHYKTYFDMGKENPEYYYMGADDGNLDYYFIYGADMHEVVSGYAYLTGTHELPQLWTLGYHQSRWSYESETELKDIAKKLREYEIPCDALYLDIDFMDHFKIFTWNKENFPKPGKMMKDLKKDGFKVVTIVDPAIKQEEGYPVYEEGMERDYFLKGPDGQVYYNKVWPGTCAYPDFSEEKVRQWWAHYEKELLADGVAGIWNDMNEPASFCGELPGDVVFGNDGKPAIHDEMHNLYGNFMAEATYRGWRACSEKRPFIITRACFSGAQKYCMNWTGDNQSLWILLQTAIPQMCNMGLSGMGFTGTDVGGYGSDCTGELFARWMEVGCFSPFFRNHSSRPSRRQEPWKFGKEVLDISRTYIQLRYQLIPYYYDLFRQQAETGIPVMRPLVLEYERDQNVRELNDEFMIGPSLLAAPVVEQGKRQRMVYLPEGEWTDYWTGEKVAGGKHLVAEVPLAHCPLYLRDHSMIPCYPVQNYIGEQEIEELRLRISGKEASYVHYQDNGEDYRYRDGEYNEYLFELIDGRFQVSFIHEGYKKQYRSFCLIHEGSKYTVSADEALKGVMLSSLPIFH